MSVSALQYWIWLSSRTGVTAAERQRLMVAFGSPERVYFADEEELRPLDLSEKAKAALSDRSLKEAEEILAACDRIGCRAVTLQDAEYPRRLRQIFDPPLLLYVTGRALRFDDEAVIAVVGSRDASPYGLWCAKTMGYQLASRGAVVLSGLARGIDSTAMTAALQAGGTAVGVLGCGPDVIYPAGNRPLYEDVASRGCLLTEYPPGTPPLGEHFPRRNRIMSGLSLGVLVVEASERSGALITARHALEQGRDVFALPANIDAPKAQGGNGLIRDGEAELVTGAEDILQRYVPQFRGKLRYRPSGSQSAEDLPEPKLTEEKPKSAQPAPAPERDEIETVPASKQKTMFSDDEMAILRCLEREPLQSDDIIAVTGLPARRALSALTVLELRGMLRQREGSWFEALVRLE